QQLWGDPEAAIRLLTPLAEDHPEAMVFYLLGTCQAEMYLREMKARRAGAARRRAEAAGRLFDRAAAAAGGVPPAPPRAPAPLHATAIEGALIGDDFDADPARVRRVLDGARRVLREGTQDPASGAPSLPVLLTALPVRLQRAVLLEWEAEQP